MEREMQDSGCETDEKKGKKLRVKNMTSKRVRIRDQVQAHRSRAKKK